MDDTLSPHKEAVLRAALDRGLLGGDRLLAAFIDVDGVEATVASLHAAFGPHATHTFAAKANCLERVLRLVRACGMGCEVASHGELHQALAAGFPPEAIVFDSPAKTWEDLRFALERGIAVNIDSFEEYERVRAIVGDDAPRSVLGFRLNPQVGVGTIAAMSTATRTSKFGVALDDHREALLAAYVRHPWLTAVHTHVGSQGCPVELIVHGIARAAAFADAVDAAAGRRQVTTLDIGGGLPVNFESDAVAPTFADFAAALDEGVPGLFSGSRRIVTEFGRSLLAKNGFIAARVEYTKTTGGHRIAITHAGAQVATRTVFMPDLWALRVSAADAAGRAKGGERVEQDVAGPCCFAGDLLARERRLPALAAGDWVVVHDTGAYYFSTPFQYNSLPRIAVWGFRRDTAGAVAFEPFCEAETIAQILAATRAPTPR